MCSNSNHKQHHLCIYCVRGNSRLTKPTINMLTFLLRGEQLMQMRRKKVTRLNRTDWRGSMRSLCACGERGGACCSHRVWRASRSSTASRPWFLIPFKEEEEYSTEVSDKVPVIISGTRARRGDVNPPPPTFMTLYGRSVDDVTSLSHTWHLIYWSPDRRRRITISSTGGKITKLWWK